MHHGKARDEFVQELGTKALTDIDYGILTGEVRPAHSGVIVTVGVLVVVAFLSITAEYTSARAYILIDFDIFLSPVIRQAWRGNVANRAVIGQRNKPVQHGLRIGINGHHIPRIRQAVIRI